MPRKFYQRAHASTKLIMTLVRSSIGTFAEFVLLEAKNTGRQQKIVGYLVQKRVRHCKLAVPSIENQQESKDRMGQVKGLMYRKVCKKSRSRTVYNKCIHNAQCVNWRAEWSKFCNR